MADARAIAAAQARRYFKSKRDRNIFLRQMGAESNFQDQTSPAGAQGYAQIMPGTAKAWGVRNVHDPEQSYAAAAAHMRQYLDAYHGSWAKALTAYNAGPGAVGGRLPAETQGYISKILGGSDVAASGGGSSAAAALPAESNARVELGHKTTFDQAGFDQAKKRFVLAGLLAKHGTDSPLFKTGVLSLTAPNEADFSKTSLTSKIVGGAAGASPRSAAAARGGSGRTPTARPGKVIGTPYAGTHTLGNWQSDNAVDIAVPEGTPMVALQDGEVVKVRHHPQDGGRFAGDQITVRAANGNEYFYAHGIAHVRPGQKIRRGQKLGVTGSANGVAHLHFGQMKGDPRMHTR